MESKKKTRNNSKAKKSKAKSILPENYNYKKTHTFFPSLFNNSMSVARFIPENVPQLSYAMPNYNDPNLMSHAIDDNTNKLFGNDNQTVPIEIGDFGNLDYDEHNIMIGGQNTFLPYMSSLLQPFIDVNMKYQHIDDPAVIMNETGRGMKNLTYFNGINGIKPHPTMNVISRI
jgi:hypothetical protein